MRFSERLNEWMELADCTAKELSEACGLSAATLSRFRSGERTPDQEGLNLLLQGLCSIAACKGKQLSPDSLYAQCTDCMDLQRSDPEALRTKINRLLTVLHISSAELAKAISYDPSFLSRIRSGQRAPADPKRFAADVARFVVRRFDGESGRSAVAHMLGVPFGSLSGEAEYFRAVADWLMGSAAAEDTESSSVSAFLNAMNSFDLNEYIRAIHFDELCVPNVPFLLQTARTYHGLEEMKKGELDFFKATVLSKSTEPVFLYSDMPMEDMAADLDFSKKYMLGLALLLKKGLHLNIIHSLNRPFQEMMLGLESHIPLYMTGQAPVCMRQSADLEILVRPGDIGVRSVARAGLNAGEQSEDQDKHGRGGGHHADRDAEAGVGLLQVRAGASDRSAGGVRGGIIGGEILPCGGRVGRSPAALGQNGQNAVNGRLIQRRAVQIAAQKRLKMLG